MYFPVLFHYADVLGEGSVHVVNFDDFSGGRGGDGPSGGDERERGGEEGVAAAAAAAAAAVTHPEAGAGARPSAGGGDITTAYPGDAADGDGVVPLPGRARRALVGVLQFAGLGGCPWTPPSAVRRRWGGDAGAWGGVSGRDEDEPPHPPLPLPAPPAPPGSTLGDAGGGGNSGAAGRGGRIEGLGGRLQLSQDMYARPSLARLDATFILHIQARQPLADLPFRCVFGPPG